MAVGECMVGEQDSSFHLAVTRPAPRYVQPCAVRNSGLAVTCSLSMSCHVFAQHELSLFAQWDNPWFRAFFPGESKVAASFLPQTGEFS
jgi:hypothetical protein